MPLHNADVHVYWNSLDVPKWCPVGAPPPPIATDPKTTQHPHLTSNVVSNLFCRCFIWCTCIAGLGIHESYLRAFDGDLLHVPRASCTLKCESTHPLDVWVTYEWHDACFGRWVRIPRAGLPLSTRNLDRQRMFKNTAYLNPRKITSAIRGNYNAKACEFYPMQLSYLDDTSKACRSGGLPGPINSGKSASKYGHAGCPEVLFLNMETLVVWCLERILDRSSSRHTRRPPTNGYID